MRICNETIEALKSEGILVRWYPDESYDEFARRIWQEQYDYYYRYTKDNVRGSKATEEGRTNVLYDSMEEFEAKCKHFADTTWKRHADPYEFDTLYIVYDGEKTFAKKENVKSKLITEEYIKKLVEKNRKTYSGTYGKFAIMMQKLCRAEGLANRLMVYPTTYGIGIWVLWNFNVDEYVERVRKIMSDRNIEYYNEYSEHGWVYRFKVSKKSANIEKLAV